DLRFHLRRVVAPEPGTLDTVLEMARRAEMQEFDHARPMWHMTLVDGLTDGASALVIKLHHALADGIGALQVAMLVFELESAPRRRAGGDAALRPPPRPGRPRPAAPDPCGGRARRLGRAPPCPGVRRRPG